VRWICPLCVGCVAPACKPAGLYIYNNPLLMRIFMFPSHIVIEVTISTPHTMGDAAIISHMRTGTRHRVSSTQCMIDPCELHTSLHTPHTRRHLHINGTHCALPSVSGCRYVTPFQLPNIQIQQPATTKLPLADLLTPPPLTMAHMVSTFAIVTVALLAVPSMGQVSTVFAWLKLYPLAGVPRSFPRSYAHVYVMCMRMVPVVPVCVAV
jgi:hypothetical protein